MAGAVQKFEEPFFGYYLLTFQPLKLEFNVFLQHLKRNNIIFKLTKTKTPIAYFFRHKFFGPLTSLTQRDTRHRNIAQIIGKCTKHFTSLFHIAFLPEFSLTDTVSLSNSCSLLSTYISLVLLSFDSSSPAVLGLTTHVPSGTYKLTSSFSSAKAGPSLKLN